MNRAERDANKQAQLSEMYIQSQGRKSNWKSIAAFTWLSFSLALTCWWILFGLSQAEKISQLLGSQNNPQVTNEITRNHRMLLSEGATLAVLLLIGGVALLYHIRVEAIRAQKMKEFFATFTHEIKTSLASLRLQAEALEEDSVGSSHEKLLKRLVKDTVRLELQLENSLMLASPDVSSRFLLEPINVNNLIESISHHWPELKFQIKSPSTSNFVIGDKRAMESIFKNLFQNASIHGRAQKISIEISEAGQNDEFLTVDVKDDGRGFKGNAKRLGQIFERHSSTSGSGIGLFLVSDLTDKLGGKVRLNPQAKSKEGFEVEIQLPLARGQA